MDDFALPAELLNGSQKPQVLVIIEHQVLARTCILSILKRELTGFRNRRNGHDEWSELVIRKRCPPLR